MTKHHAFRFSNVGMTKGRALVELDGQDISDVVKGVAVDAGSRETPRVMVELMAPEQDITVEEAEIQLPAKTMALLQQLGWATPQEYQALVHAAVKVTTFTGDLGGADIFTQLRQQEAVPVHGPDLAKLLEVLCAKPRQIQ